LKKFTLVIVLLTALSLSASAQWYQILKKHERLPLIVSAKNTSAKHLSIPATAIAKIPAFHPEMTDYMMVINEQRIIKEVRHNMSWRIYDQASYNFSDLAQLYIKQKRLSEAKWYLLQSTTLARRTNDDRHIVTNLMSLALVKTDLGEPTLAQQDLAEACGLATAHNWSDNVAAIEKEIKFIQLYKSTAKVVLHYADDAMITAKKDDKKVVTN